MRIFLIERGGFVGVPLRYEVDVSALDATVLSALEHAMATRAAGPQPPPTSAGEVRIRVERDDANIDELSLSHTAPDRELGELVQRLRASAKIVRNH